MRKDFPTLVTIIKGAANTVTRKRFVITIVVTTIFVIVSGCNLVHVSSPAKLPGVQQLESPSLEGTWNFVKSESDIQWHEHKWLVESREKSGYELTEIVDGHEIPYNFRGKLLKVNNRRLLQVQARSWPPGTVPVFAVYELKTQSKDRVTLASPNRKKLLRVLETKKFNSLDVIRKKDYPILVSSSGKRAGQFLEKLLEGNVFTEQLVFERIKP